MFPQPWFNLLRFLLPCAWNFPPWIMTKTFLLVTVKAAVNRDVAKAHSKGTLAPMAAAAQMEGFSPFASKVVWPLSHFPPSYPLARPEDGVLWMEGDVLRSSPNTQGLHDSAFCCPPIPGHRSSLPNLRCSQLALDKKKNLTLASLGNASAVKVESLMSWW